MKKQLIIKLMPTIYFEMNLIQIEGVKPDYNIKNRQVYLPNTNDLEVVLDLLSEIMLSKERKLLFCLNWGRLSYYFEKDGSFFLNSQSPRSDVL
jgi:hypothetical protein